MNSYYYCVLIETYWNVKIYTREIYYDNDGVLIETYWNVKVPVATNPGTTTRY